MASTNDIKKVKQRFESAWLTYRSVTGIGIGPKIVNGKTTDEAIRVYVRRKGDVPEGELIPETVEGTSTDIIEREFIPCALHSDPDVGVSIGPCRGSDTSINCGTLGAIVLDNVTNAPLALGCGHAMSCSNQGEGSEDATCYVTQPSLEDGGTCPASIIGELKKATIGNAVDCAVATIATATSSTDCYEVLNFQSLNGTGAASIGRSVYKFGRTTGVTYGTVDTVDLTIKLDFSQGQKLVTLSEQIGILVKEQQQEAAGDHLFVRRGDSGALVIDDNTHDVIGLLCGMDKSGIYGVANPIEQVMGALGVSMIGEWACLSAAETGPFADGQFVATRNPDGRLELFVVGRDGTLYHTWQIAPKKGWLGRWMPMLPPGWNVRNESVAIGHNADGRFELCFSGVGPSADTQRPYLYHTWQLEANDGWCNVIERLGWVDGMRLAVTRRNSGELKLFVLNSDGSVCFGWQTEAHERVTWNNFTQYCTNDAPPGGFTELAAEHDELGRVFLVATGINKGIYYCFQKDPEVPYKWSSWYSLRDGFGKNLIVLKNRHKKGRLEVLCIGMDGLVWHAVLKQKEWIGWDQVGDKQGKMLAVGQNADGRLEAFLIALDDDRVWHIKQSSAGKWPAKWLKLRASPEGSRLAVVDNKDGRLEVFLQGKNQGGDDGSIYHCWQWWPGGIWL
jgi:hypothetical protein